MTIYLISKTGGTMLFWGTDSRAIADTALREFPGHWREVTREEWQKARRKQK